jgi:hypothetical protein
VEHGVNKTIMKSFLKIGLCTLLTEVWLMWFEDENEDANGDSELVSERSSKDDYIYSNCSV